MSYPWPHSSDPNWQWSQQYYQQQVPPYGHGQQQQQNYYNTPPVPAQQNGSYYQHQPDNGASVVHQLQQQTQQRQNLGALAAASINSALRPSQPFVSYQQQQQQPEQHYQYQSQPQPQHHAYYHQPNQQQQQQQQQQQPTKQPDYTQRSVVAYDDLSTSNTTPQSTFCCNRYYRSAKAIEQHEAQHIKCSECSFAAIKSVLDEHLATEHGIGESKKKSKPDGIVPPNAPKIDTPEALAAWIEARKKNWPSKANVERKKKEAEARQARGQLADSKNSKKRKREEKEPKKEGALGALGDYGSDDSDNESDDDDDDDGSVDLEQDAVTSKDPSSMGKIALPDKPQRAGQRCRAFMRGSCRFGDKCRYVHEKPQQQRKQQQNHNVRPVQKRPNLLRMLLSKEIREEHNVILQCFRHMVDHDFYGKGVSQQQE